VVNLFRVKRDFLALTLDPGLRESGGEEWRTVENQAVEVVSLAKGNEGDVGVPSFEQATGVEVVRQGYRIVGG
jgi:hypothetical protein